MRRNDAKFKPGKRQASTQPPPVSTEAKTASTSEQAAKSKPVERQTSTQPPSASREAKSASTSEEAATEAFFDTMQSLRQQEISDKAIAQVLSRNLLMRINAFFGQIDQAFKEQPFNLAWLPDVKPNQQRLTAYVKYYALVAKLLRLAVELSVAIGSMPNTKPTGTGADDAC